VPDSLANWRKARADIAHDWLERRLLPILNTPGASLDDSLRRARLCLDAWIDDVIPRLDSAMTLLPHCLLPGLLIHRWLDRESVRRVNAVILEREVTKHVVLQDVVPEIRRFADAAKTALDAFAINPTDEQRQNAFNRVMDVRTLLQQLPRSVVLS
jgi:hypothetical protein